MAEIRVRRSVLFMPGSNPRALEKARTLDCDVVVLDLEDAVAPETKIAARDSVCAAVRTFGRRETVVRINALSTPWGQDDLAAVRAARPNAILLPKVSGAADIGAARGDIPLWAMIETARGILDLDPIAAAGAEVLVLGANDLIKDMRAAPMPSRENLWFAMSRTVTVARAHGLDVIDATYNQIADIAGFTAECEQGRDFGFDGKSLIHPAQIDIANQVFAPGAEAIAQARRIVAAFAEPQNGGRGAIALDGRMVERLHADDAMRLLARAEAIAGRDA